MDIKGWVVQFIEFILGVYDSALKGFFAFLTWAPAAVSANSLDSDALGNLDPLSRVFLGMHSRFEPIILSLGISLAAGCWMIQFSKTTTLMIEDKSHLRLLKSLLRASLALAAVRLSWTLVYQSMHLVAVIAQSIVGRGLQSSFLSSAEKPNVLQNVLQWELVKPSFEELGTAVSFIVAIMSIIFAVVLIGSAFAFVSVILNRLIRIFSFAVLAPLSMALTASEDTSHIPKQFAKSFCALLAEVFVIVLVIEVAVSIVYTVPDIIPSLRYEQRTQDNELASLKQQREKVSQELAEIDAPPSGQDTLRIQQIELEIMNIDNQLAGELSPEERQRLEQQRAALLQERDTLLNPPTTQKENRKTELQQQLQELDRRIAEAENRPKAAALPETLKFFALGIFASAMIGTAVKGAEKMSRELFAGGG